MSVPNNTSRESDYACFSKVDYSFLKKNGELKVSVRAKGEKKDKVYIEIYD